MNPLPKASFPLAVVILLALLGCGSDTTTSPVVQARTEVEAVTQTSISGIVGAVASPAPVVRVFDSKTHKPLAEIPVEFRVILGGGYITNAIVITDSAGHASPGDWTFATRPGVSSLGVYLNGVFALSFKATLTTDVAAQVIPITGTDQAALQGHSVDGPSVFVRDRFNNPIAGIAVSFTVADGGGVLEKNSAITGTDGFAREGLWTLGTTPGHNQAVAIVTGLDPVVFNAESLDPATMKWYDLVSVRSGDIDFLPIDQGVSSARIGLTQFDPCLCKKQDGYFLDEVLYSIIGAQTGRTSGRYHLDGHFLTISSLNNPGTIQEGELFLQRPDPDFEFTNTWVYKEISP
jgi:hypothetical protein